MFFVVFGWLAVALTVVFPFSGWLGLLAILAAIIICAFGVMRFANALAARLGDPYGTLILTLSITTIEVILVASVLLGEGNNPTIARDSTFSAAMLLLNLLMGIALVLGGLRHGGLSFSPTGITQYMSVLVVLGALSFVLPLLLADAPSRTLQAVVAILIILLYGFFLYCQLWPNASDFQEPGGATEPTNDPIWPNVLGLLATMVPIVLLSNTMTPLLNEAVPHAELAGLLVAVVVLMPETFTTIAAGWRGEGQRVSNLTHGALVSVVGITVPVVLLISVVTGQTVEFGLPASNLTLLGLTVALSALTGITGQGRTLHGVSHLALFGMYVVVLASAS